MSYTELEHGYQGLRSATNQPIFYVGDIEAVQQGLVGPGGSPIYHSSNRGELSDGCINDDGCLGGTDLEGEGKQVLVGICAMAKKSQSKPMKEILTRLEEFEYIKILVFAEDVILKEPVEDWPIVDCLISFHSKGFPLDKAIQYAKLRNPFIINNLPMQYDIQDRRRVYSILEGEGIEIPRYAVLDRDSADPKYHELVESEDHVEVNGVTFNKPFVEKPVSAEDHNIYIYYPTSAGGGSQRLFRKIGSRSSVYSPESRVRKTGSYIYEDFMPTDGTDVKVYTVGPDYAHAEARKSPALDGKVERDSEGKEIRYPVILSNAEKLISRKVCLAFKQTVCGFDLLRANGQSFVCDVNGFSFVKNSNKYYDDCAKILGNMILRELAPTLHIPWSVPFQLDDPPIVPTTFGKMMELRCVVAVIRHGDRTPKQKMKVEVRHPKFFEIFVKYDGYKHGHVKLKRPKQLQEILDTARSLLTEIQHRAAGPELEEKQGKLEQLKSVLEMYGHFSGINRKVQMKYQPRGRPRGSSSDDGNTTNRLGEPSLVLILKWGGELTPAGRIQAEELGRIFRCMYPGGQGRHLSGEYAGAQGLGLLRLHSTFRHDLKIYASDEGRVQMTAAAFAKGLLALEGELTPILVQMVKSANTNGLLDNDCDSSKYQNMVKNRLHELLQQDKEFTHEDREQINPTNALSINAALDFVKNPVRCCQHVHLLIQKLMDIVRIKKDDPKTKDAILYHGESWELMGRRWGKIEKDFCTKQKRFDISKIPDIYDCIKYDLQHNNHTLQFEHAEELYIYSKYLADIVIPQEYGLTVQEKLTISQGICTPLLKKIRADLQRNIEEPGEETVNRLNPRYSHGVSSPGRHVRTRLYFTSESHVHSLLTVLRYGGLLDVLSDEQWRRAMEYVSMVSELNYMSQIVVMLYEDPTKDPSSEERFHVELHFSPGVNCCVQKNLPPGPGFRPHSRNESSHNLGEVGFGQDSISQCSTRIDEEDTELGVSEDDVIPPLEIKRNHIFKDTSPSLMEVDVSDSVLDSPISTIRTINMMDLDPNIMDEPYDSGFLQSSTPIPISARTVAGHEAARLGSQLAATQRQRREREVGVMCEPRARSYDHQRQEKPDKTADKLQYQSLNAVNKEANSRVSKSPKFTEIFREGKEPSSHLGKPVELAHSISSPELVPTPIINVFQDLPPPPLGSPNSPLITLHNTPLISPGIVSNSNPCDYKTSVAAVAAATVATTVSATSLKLISDDEGDPTSCNSSLLRLPNVIKKYGRSRSAMTLPIIEISGEFTGSDRDDNGDGEEPLSSSEVAPMKKGSSDACCAGLLLSPPMLHNNAHRHYGHHHCHHRYRYDCLHPHSYLHRQQQHLHQHLNDQRYFSSNAFLNPHHQQFKYDQGHSVSYNQLEVVTNALLDKRSRSLSPRHCSCYNCNVSELIMQSRDLSPSERSNFHTYFVRSLSHKFSNCSCYSMSQPYETLNSSCSLSYCSDTSNSSLLDNTNFESHALHFPSKSSSNYKRFHSVASRLAKFSSCPELVLRAGKSYCKQRSNSLNSVLPSSSSSPFLLSCLSKLHLSCSLDCLMTALVHDNICYYHCKRYCTPIVDAAADKIWTQKDFGDGFGTSGCVDDTVLWLGRTQRRHKRQQSCCVCHLTTIRHCCDDEPSHKFINNTSLHCHHPCTCVTDTNYTNYSKNHHYHRPFLHMLHQQRSFSSPDTRPSIIQPDPTCTARRHRHSISGQMSYFKLLGYNVSKKLTGSANSLFSTAVISGSSSAPNLKDMVPPHASAVAAIEGFGGVPPIRPLETLHNALSLRQLDSFLEMMTGVPLFRTPASSPPIGPGPAGHQQNLGIDATRNIAPTMIQCKGSHDNELNDIRNQVSPTSPNSTGWSSEPQSFLSSEPSSPAPTSTGECSMSISLVSNDGSQPISTGAKYSSNRCLDLGYNDFCTNIDQESRESRGSVSYTDYYSSEDGQIRRSANDNCFPIFVKLVVRPSVDDATGSENPDEDEDHTLTLKQTDEQKKQDVQGIFEQKEAQTATKSNISYKKIGRFRVESTDISECDIRIKETSVLDTSISAEMSRCQPKQNMGAVPKRSNNLLRSQSVYTPKTPTSSCNKSVHLSKQNSLTIASNPNDTEASGTSSGSTVQLIESSLADVEEPTLTLARSFTDTSNVTFGFDLPQKKKE